MGFKGFNLSDEGVERLLNKLTAIASEVGDSTDSHSMEETLITTDFIKKVTKVKDLEDVILRESELTKNFYGFLHMYGFESMYDMYIYGMSCDDLKEPIVKAKDYSKLIPQKRKVVRNGKEMEVTVWVRPVDGDPNSEESQYQTRARPKGRRGTNRSKRARDMASTITEKVKDIGDVDLKLPQGNKPIQAGSTFFLEIKEGDSIVGLVGYSTEGKYLVMDFYRHNGEVSGVASKGFIEMFDLAFKEGLGIKMSDVEQARPLYEQMGMVQKSDSYWVIEAEEIQELLDEGSGEG